MIVEIFEQIRIILSKFCVRKTDELYRSVLLKKFENHESFLESDVIHQTALNYLRLYMIFSN